MGTLKQIYYWWRKIYGGMKADQVKKYKDLELENLRLKKLSGLIVMRSHTLGSR